MNYKKILLPCLFGFFILNGYGQTLDGTAQFKVIKGDTFWLPTINDLNLVLNPAKPVGSVISPTETFVVGDSTNTIQALIDLMQDSIKDTSVFRVNFPADVSTVVPLVGRAIFVNYTGEIRYCNGTNCNTVLQFPNGTRAANSIGVLGATVTPDNTATSYDVSDAGAITINNPSSSHGERSRYLFRVLNTSASANTINLGTNYYDNVGNQIGSINVAGNAETVLEFEQVNGVFVLQSATGSGLPTVAGTVISPSENLIVGDSTNTVQQFIDLIQDSIPGDNLGNHQATQNIRLNSNWLSNDGDNEGIRVASTTGNVGINMIPNNSVLAVKQSTDAAGFGFTLYSSTTNDYLALYSNNADVGGIQSGDGTGFRNLALNPLGGDVGIGTSVPSAKLDIVGTGTTSATTALEVNNSAANIITVLDDRSVTINTGTGTGVNIPAGTSSWVSNSDRRLKTNITPISYGLNTVMAMKPSAYNYISTDKTSLGFIAQEMEEIVPEVVSENSDGYLGIGYTELIPVLVKAIQDQQAVIEKLEARIKTLENK